MTGWPRVLDRRAGAALFVGSLLAAVVSSIDGWGPAAVALGCAWMVGIASSRPDPEGVPVPRWTTVAIVLLLAATTFFVACSSQPTVTLNDGLGWDGRNYHALYQIIRSGASDRPPAFPFHQRLGVPALASVLPLAERPAFLVLTLLFYAAALGLLARFWPVRRSIRSDLTVAACGWLCLHWISPLRAGVCYPLNIDASTFFFDTAFLVLLGSPRPSRWLPAVAFVGALFKESSLLTACLWLASTAVMSALREGPRREALRRKLPILLVAAVTAFLGKSLAGSLIAHGPQLSGSIGETLRHWTEVRVDEPLNLLRLLAALVTVYGGWLLVPLAVVSAQPQGDRERPTDHLDDGTLLLWLALWIGVTFFSGSDLSRFAWQAAPVAMTLGLSTLQRGAPRCALLLCLTSLPFTRLLTVVPSPLGGHLTPHHDYAGAYSWLMEYAHYSHVAAWAVFGLVYWLAAERALRDAGSADAAQRPVRSEP